MPGTSKLAEAIEGHPYTKGLAIIITNDYQNNPQLSALPGIHRDGEEMQKAFARLNIATHCECNITGSRLREVVAEFREYFKSNHPPNYSEKYGCMSFIFSGYGSEGDSLIGQDGEEVSLHEEIVRPLLEEGGLDGKLGRTPRLFFIDACRGNGKYEPFHPPVSLTSSQAGNCMIAYATIPSFESWMDPETEGSAWLQVVAQELGKGDDLVQNAVSKVTERLWEKHKDKSWLKKYQQPSTNLRLHRTLYLGRRPAAMKNTQRSDLGDENDADVDIWSHVIHYMVTLRTYFQSRGSGNGRKTSWLWWCLATGIIIAAVGVYGFQQAELDECAAGTHSCDPNAICTDTGESCICTCSPGFQGDGVTCTNIEAQ